MHDTAYIDPPHWTKELAILPVDLAASGMLGASARLAGLTDEDGFIPTVPMLVSTNDGGNLTKHGPYEVIVRTDQVMIRDTIDATGWTGRVYTLPGNVTSVESAVAGTSRMRISPMPAAVGGNVRIATGRLAAGSATARLHDINGTERGTFVIGVSSEAEATLQLPHDLAPGFYLLHLVDRGGTEGTVRVIVQ